MGIDAGFDLYPPLLASSADCLDWDNFLSEIKSKYINDPNVKVQGNGDVAITLGEHPTLLKEGHRFRRFSSKVSGYRGGDVNRYLREVYEIAKIHFSWK